MRLRPAVSVLTLIAFLPLAAGCSARRTSYVHDDFVTDETTARLAAGEEIWISGYTTRSQGFRRWNGHVSTAGVDSLHFQPSERESKPHDEPGEPAFRLARGEVISLELETRDGASTVAVVAFAVAIGAIALTIMLASAVADAFQGHNWFQGSR